MKVEETFCNVCRNEVNQILRDSYYNSADNNNTKFEGIVEQQMFYGCVTPQKNPVY
jgi:K+-transporting ATPase A subunit